MPASPFAPDTPPAAAVNRGAGGPHFALGSAGPTGNKRGGGTLTAAPPLVLMALVTGLGLWIPGAVAGLLRSAAALVTG